MPDSAFLRRLPRRGWIPALLLAFLVACGGDTPPPDGSPQAGADPVTLAYAPALGVDFDTMEQTAGGVWYRDDVVGEGEAATPGQAALVHYTGYFPDGRSFDSSRTGGEPFPVQIGAGLVIPGWDDGLPGMRVGGRRLLVIPPEMAYGAAGAGGVIPPHAVLVFEVELLELH